MPVSKLGSPLTAFARLGAYLAFTLPCMPVQLLLLKLPSQARARFPHWYHRQCCRLLGIRIEVLGTPSPVRPTLYVSNHVSYLDIIVYSAIWPISFVAKAEVARWPFFGWLAKLQRTVFIDRRMRRAARHRDEIARRLEAGDDLLLFPEGTSSDGNRVLPFKSSLFAVTEVRPGGNPLTVQPVSIAYTRLDGVPMGRYLRPFFAWYGAMELGGHLWRAVGMGLVTVVVQFHRPATLADFASRKELAEHCQRLVARGVSDALADRNGRGGEEGRLAPPARDAEAAA